MQEFLALLFFPNISLIFKLSAIVAFSFLDYVILLINNVFLVIEDREEVIPLYRVAVTWSLILQIIVLIPLVASVYKFNVSSFYQAAAVAVLSFFYSFSTSFFHLLLYNRNISRYQCDRKCSRKY